jgi:tetratricopeptide (TPR) repeat protein
MASTKGADGVFVLDTGSSDKTVELLKAAGAVVGEHIFTFDEWPEVYFAEEKMTNIEWAKSKGMTPWRFDMARNAALALIPADYDLAVVLDLDEVLADGWREALEKHLKEGATRIQATYTFNYKADGKPDLVYFMDRAHTRKNYMWRGIVHEYEVCTQGPEKTIASAEFKINHHQDCGKSRDQYLSLLELATREDPHQDRNSHYLGREYFYRQRWLDCIKELTRHLKLPSAGWEAERAASMKYIAGAYNALGNLREAHRWFLRAVAEWPEDREPWLALGLFYLHHRNYSGGYYAAAQALSLVNRPLHYMTTAEAWGAQPHDLAACCAAWMKNHALALEHYAKAMELDPENARIKSDYELTLSMMREHKASANPAGFVDLVKTVNAVNIQQAKNKILMCLVSRGRPKQALEALESWRQNNAGCSDVCLVLDADDAGNYPVAEIKDCLVEILPPARVGPQLNKVALKYAPIYKAIGFIGDDHRIRTKGFDKLWLDELNKMGHGVVYGDDLFRGESLAGQAAMSSEIILALGYMHWIKLQHMYIDNCWMEIGRALGKLKYTPGVVIEHLHPDARKAQWDRMYDWGHAVFAQDGVEFKAWRESPVFTEQIGRLGLKLCKLEAKV